MIEFCLPPVGVLTDVHAEQRAKERYGVVLSEGDRAAMLRQIAEDRAVFFTSAPTSKKLKIFLVWWPSASRIVAVYYRQGRIETVLPDTKVHNVIETKVSGWRSRAKSAEAELRMLKTGVGGKRTSNPW